MQGPGSLQTHFDLVTRAHRFLLDALPLRHPESQIALEGFSEYLAACEAHPPIIDAVLLRCLIVVDRHTGGRLPTMAERYTVHSGLEGCATRFRTCMDDLLRYRGISNPLVAQAIAAIDSRYSESALESILTRELHVTSRQLTDAFKKATGLTTSEYIKEVRLSRAARLLVETHEHKIWAQVGYGPTSDSNFNHDFKKHFGMTPGDYRKRGLPSTLPRDAAMSDPYARAGRCFHPNRRDGGYPAQRPQVDRSDCAGRAMLHPAGPTRVLLIEDDETCTETTANFLRANHYVVATALTGEHGLHEVSSLAPDVVLIDQWLGDGMNGLDCLRAIRRQRSRRQPAVVVHSADWDLYTYEDEIRDNRALLLPKPYDLDRLHELLILLSGRTDKFGPSQPREDTATGLRSHAANALVITTRRSGR